MWLFLLFLAACGETNCDNGECTGDDTGGGGCMDGETGLDCG